MKAIISLVGGPIRLGEKRGRFAQDLIRLSELPVLPLQLLEAFTFSLQEPPLWVLLTLCKAHPVSQRLRAATELLGDTDDRSPLRRVLLGLLQDESDRSLPDLC
jgi:hypothetical protein